MNDALTGEALVGVQMTGIFALLAAWALLWFVAIEFGEDWFLLLWGALNFATLVGYGFWAMTR